MNNSISGIPNYSAWNYITGTNLLVLPTDKLLKNTAFYSTDAKVIIASNGIAKLSIVELEKEPMLGKLEPQFFKPA